MKIVRDMGYCAIRPILESMQKDIGEVEVLIPVSKGEGNSAMECRLQEATMVEKELITNFLNSSPDNESVAWNDMIAKSEILNELCGKRYIPSYEE